LPIVNSAFHWLLIWPFPGLVAMGFEVRTRCGKLSR
jgi:hypothetical protein